MNLNADNLTIDVPDGRVTIEPQYLQYLRLQGYRLDAVDELHAVESSSNKEQGHVVMKVKTYDYPRTRDDYLDHGIELWICDCSDFRYRCSADVSESFVQPSQSEACKHIQSVSKVQRAANDDQQMQL